ncbi:glucose-1-phosphate cytidylyltransferase [Paenibacillus alkaliterrae]|uniref:glucose-1-phosphate cytidylyltransferase n=1 Tax=Paenibacillus alkaliterrae TaxID=320909 RepID=UPI001F44E9EE|nr:glucose-1-phosphate cytidylyltransferase [Paenibacillus alkaliterrae]MCF2940172.1 glucose-1-phosphate cytidylyltransferase [Paenibacillus alkaliterrae]
MKVVILAGGLGTRISEETQVKPKPMVEIGTQPILWHIMKLYSAYGFHDFIVCLGYMGHSIIDYFNHYVSNHSDITFDLKRDERIIHNHPIEPWRVTLVHTGKETMTGGRIKRIQHYIGHEPFMLTYGDGLADVNFDELLRCHRDHGKIATVTATQPMGKYGSLSLAKDDRVKGFQEKPKGDGSWISGGFFVMEPEIFDLIEGDQTILEKEPLEKLAKSGQLMAYKHSGFWQSMDTLRDKQVLEEVWKTGKAPWRKWD